LIDCNIVSQYIDVRLFYRDTISLLPLLKQNKMKWTYKHKWKPKSHTINKLVSRN